MSVADRPPHPRSEDLDLARSEFPPGLSVIEASAGTGKTYSISHLVPRLLLEGILPDLPSLLLVTFTRDAARELGTRVRAVLARLAEPAEATEQEKFPDIAALREPLDPEFNPDAAGARARLTRACSQLDLLAVSTIHSFCQRTLQQEGALCGLAVMPDVITDDGELLDTLLRDAWIRELCNRPVAAAIATSEGWSVDGARELAMRLRATHGGTLAPSLAPSVDIEKRLAEACARVTDPNVHGDFLRELSKVEKWNKELDSERVLRRLQPFCDARPETVACWKLMREASDLGTWISARGERQRSMKERILAHPFMQAVDEACRLVGTLMWSFFADLASEALQESEAQLRKDRTLTQDGLVERLHQALHRDGTEGSLLAERLVARLRQRYSVALIDESQDTDQRQLAIFRRIFLESPEPGRLILVGDPKQSIYGFRGADLPSYLETRSGTESVLTLRRTYRAPGALVEALNALFRPSGSFHHPGLEFPPAESALKGDLRLQVCGQAVSPVEIWRTPDADRGRFQAASSREGELAQITATSISRLLRNGELVRTEPDEETEDRRPVRPGDCAVLVSTHRQASRVSDELERLGIASVINSGADVFTTEEAADLARVLEAVLHPRRSSRVLRALATRLFGFTSVDLAALAERESQAVPFERWQQRFSNWQSVWERRGLAALLHAFDEPSPEEGRPGFPERLAALPLSGLRRVTNYRQITDLLLQASRAVAARPTELVRWLGQQRARAEGNTSDESRQLQLSADAATDARAVHVLTMHKAKGLEYPLVFCPFLCDSIRPQADYHVDRSAPNSPPSVIVLPMLDEKQREAFEDARRSAELEERLRLAYVALTRAKARVWTALYRTSPRSDLGSALDWILRPAAEARAHPRYSREWSSEVKQSGAARWETALRERGALTLGEEGAQHGILFVDPPSAEPTADAGEDIEGAAPTPELRSALPAPAVPDGWRVLSFTGLTSEKHAHGAPVRPPRRPIEPTAEHRIAFFSQPGSAAIGTAVHDWIQAWDFSPVDANSEALEAHASMARLPRIQEPETWTNVLAELFNTLREIRLPGCGDIPLHRLCPEAHASEWNFHLPLPRGGITGAALAACFERHGAPEHRAYASQLAPLPGDRLGGLLQGFIDRLVRCGPAWGLVDWKTNFLGPALQDYSHEGMLACAMREHYLLQMHLYLVALRRYLRLLPNQPPLPGAWLVFVRAIEPGSTRGVLSISPPEPMLDALESLLVPATP